MKAAMTRSQRGQGVLVDVALGQKRQAHERLELGGEPSLLVQPLFQTLHQPRVLERAYDLRRGLEDDFVAWPAPGRAAGAQCQEPDGLVAAAEVDDEAGRQPFPGKGGARFGAGQELPQALVGYDGPGCLQGLGELRHVGRDHELKELRTQATAGLDLIGLTVLAPGHDDPDIGHGGFAEALEGCFGHFAAGPGAPGGHGQ
jgi:hypothetical protein